MCVPAYSSNRAEMEQSVTKLILKIADGTPMTAVAAVLSNYVIDQCIVIEAQRREIIDLKCACTCLKAVLAKSV